MSEWEYRKIDLSQQPRGRDDLDMLNDAGADGWDLVGITSNNIAYLKREVAMPSPISETRSVASDQYDTNGNGSAEAGQSVKAKYRDPTTNETWSGRGRMASWLKRKQESGEKIEKYLV